MLGIYCRLKSEENVQMVTALILLLIQSVFNQHDDGCCDMSSDDDELKKVCLQIERICVLLRLFVIVNVNVKSEFISRILVANL